MRHLYALARTAALVAALLIAAPMVTSAAPEDEGLAKKVSEELIENKSFDASNITVTAEDGIVYLRGQTQNGSDVMAMENAAKQVPGVREVKSQVDVAAQNTQ